MKTVPVSPDPVSQNLRQVELKRAGEEVRSLMEWDGGANKCADKQIDTDPTMLSRHLQELREAMGFRNIYLARERGIRRASIGRVKGGCDYPTKV